MVCGPNLNMYLPKEGYDSTSIQHGQWSVAAPHEEADYVTPWDLHEHYKLTAKYPHRCENVGHRHMLSANKRWCVKSQKVPLSVHAVGNLWLLTSA